MSARLSTTFPRTRDVERFVDIHRAARRTPRDEIGEGLPFDKLHHDGPCLATAFDAVDLRDVGGG